MKYPDVKIFVDFDGTITLKDVGASFFLEFGDKEKVWDIIRKIRSLEMTAAEGWSALFATLDTISEEELAQFVLNFEIDDTFPSFLNYISEKNFEIYVVSDGFDFYIERILNREGITNLKYFSNSLIFSPGADRPEPVFPYKDEECRKCAFCKRNKVIELSSDDDITVYIGNGSSDVCASQYCDYIFAKDALLRYCETNRITYYPFDNFGQVISKLEKILNKKRVKKSGQAALKRKSLYMQG